MPSAAAWGARSDVSLVGFNTFRVAATAQRMLVIRTVDELRNASAAHSRFRPLLLGGGSNVLFVTPVVQDVLHVRLGGRALVEDAGTAVIVEGMAGEPWHDFVLWTLDQGLSGLENLALIPGTVGAAPVQNIGAYGVELERMVESVEVFDLVEGTLRWWSRAECAFGYRDSAFKHLPTDRYLITRVRFRLSRRFEPVLGYLDVRTELDRMGIGVPTPSDVANAVCAIRRRKLPDPAVIGNAGSFFKNPVVPASLAERLAETHPDLPRYPAGAGVKLPAGWLIERAGWKGHRRTTAGGGVCGVHAAHALVLVNHGGASGADLWRLACDIRDDVAAKLGVRLEPEPRIILPDAESNQFA